MRGEPPSAGSQLGTPGWLWEAVRATSWLGCFPPPSVTYLAFK